MATPRIMAPRPSAIRDIYPLIQYMQAMEKTAPYTMGTTWWMRKLKFRKLSSMMTMMMIRDRPTVHTRSRLMVPALETLPGGFP